MKSKRQFIFRMLLPSLAYASLMLMTTSCIDDPFEHSKCRTVPVAETPSPNGKYKVVVANHFCKPETEKILARHVLIKRVNTSELDTGETIFIIAGQNEVRPVWTDASHLRLECHGAQESMISFKHTEWQDVAISYDFTSP